jgi:CDP-diacylglycerol--serine O-phosphatidyltransferase
MKQLPNLFTLLNLFFGCMAIVAVLQNGIVITGDEQTGQQLLDVPEKIYMASLFIGIAAVIDFFDGFVARLLNASSAMGKQLDSLADVVSFGVAPGMIIYQFLRLSFAQHENGLDTSMIWLLPAFILPCAGAYRLARYNIDTTQSKVFKGLPIPAAGLLVASLPLIYWSDSNQWVIKLFINEWFWYGLILLLSYLMVSRIPMMSLKMHNFSVKENLAKYILVIASIAAFILLKWLAVPLVFFLYVVLSFFSKETVDTNTRKEAIDISV